jgi:putative transposase
VWPELAYHITQRGTNRQKVFFSTTDRKVYLDLLGQNRAGCGVRILAYCLMTNHVHLIAVPERPESLAVLFRRTHGRYAQYLNARLQRSGHLWQNRFYSCAVERGHLGFALRYVEMNPVRALIEKAPECYRWSSAKSHLSGSDASGVLDLDFWRQWGGAEQWRDMLATREDMLELERLRRCTYGGRPCGSEEFLRQMEERFGRVWRRTRTQALRVEAAGCESELGTERTVPETFF